MGISVTLDWCVRSARWRYPLLESRPHRGARGHAPAGGRKGRTARVHGGSRKHPVPTRPGRAACPAPARRRRRHGEERKTKAPATTWADRAHYTREIVRGSCSTRRTQRPVRSPPMRTPSRIDRRAPQRDDGSLSFVILPPPRRCRMRGPPGSVSRAQGGCLGQAPLGVSSAVAGRTRAHYARKGRGSPGACARSEGCGRDHLYGWGARGQDPPSIEAGESGPSHRAPGPAGRDHGHPSGHQRGPPDGTPWQGGRFRA